jgi:hypothetical protein
VARDKTHRQSFVDAARRALAVDDFSRDVFVDLVSLSRPSASCKASNRLVKLLLRLPPPNKLVKNFTA